MKLKLTHLFSICLLTTFFTFSSSAEIVYEVSPSGTGINSLTGIQELLRTQTTTMTEYLIILLNEGTYTFKKTLRFDSKDGGSGNYFVIYKAKEGTTPLINSRIALQD